jgi:hypothetical protein
MTAAVEITARALRLVVTEEGRITHMRSVPLDTGADPVQVLAGILPAGCGGVRVLVANEDVLVRMIIQPPCPRERLDRVIGFEMTGGGDGEVPLADWTVVPGFGAGDFRVLSLAIKRQLIQRLRQALRLAGARLEAVSHPAVGLYHAWRAAGGMGDALLADVGGSVTHLAMVRQDELALVRTLPVGMENLVSQVAEMRSLVPTEATRLVSQLRASSPEELQHLVKRQAGQIAVALTGAVKFAKAQLQVDDWQPAAIALAGSGAQIHGFVEAIADRSGIPAKPFNPFAKLGSALPPEEMDRQAGLPTPWAAALGAVQAQPVLLDALADERRAAARFWATDGILRVAVALVAVLVLVAVALNELAIHRAAGDAERLGGANGLVTTAEKDLAEITRLEAQLGRDTARIAWLDGEHRTSRIANELLSVIAGIQHPEKCPVAITTYRVKRHAGGAQVELEGWAQSAGRLRTSDVLQTFEQGLRSAYPPIAAIEERPQPIDRDRQRFHLVLSLPDRKP